MVITPTGTVVIFHEDRGDTAQVFHCDTYGNKDDLIMILTGNLLLYAWTTLYVEDSKSLFP